MVRGWRWRGGGGGAEGGQWVSCGAGADAVPRLVSSLLGVIWIIELALEHKSEKVNIQIFRVCFWSQLDISQEAEKIRAAGGTKEC